MKPDYEVLELQLRGTAQLLAEERRNHAATAQALSDAEIGGRNADVMAAAGHLVCLEWLAGIRPGGKPGHLAFNALLAAHDATTPSPEQTHVVVSKERLARLESIEQRAAAVGRGEVPSFPSRTRDLAADVAVFILGGAS